MKRPIDATDEQVAAAQLRVALDAKFSRETPERIKRLANQGTTEVSGSPTPRAPEPQSEDSAEPEVIAVRRGGRATASFTAAQLLESAGFRRLLDAIESARDQNPYQERLKALREIRDMRVDVQLLHRFSSDESEAYASLTELAEHRRSQSTDTET